MAIQHILKIGIRQAKWMCVIALLLRIVLMAPLSEAGEGKGVAFVVGIGTYDNLASDKQLKNPISDAEGVSAKLTAIGYQVTTAPNLTRSTFNAKWQNILDTITRDDTFVLYFSGHGVQITGQNYLLPRDIPFIEYGRDEQLKREAISLNELLADLSIGDRPHPKRSIVILDACRDNPFIPLGYKSASISGGLAGLQDPDGIFVIYAAASDRTALDRLSPSDNSKYSVFTRTLLPLMGRTDLTIQELSYELKEQVLKLAESVGREQRPTYYDGFRGRFCLPGCVAESNKGSVGSKKGLTRTIAPLALQEEITGNDGAPMVLIPAGEFMMGSPDSEGYKTEHPRHLVTLDGFYMDKFEVTVARYAEFLRMENWSKPDYWNQVDSRKHRNLPVVGVDWLDAKAYCEWAGKRLPTEAEWEKAARGMDGRTYPWGNEPPTARRANFGKGLTLNVYDERLAPVDSYEAGNSPFGVHHMAGNAYEWTADWYDETYYGKSPKRNPKGPSSAQYRTLRGGSWNNEPALVRSALRTRTSPTLRNDFIGFRCAQDAPK